MDNGMLNSTDSIRKRLQDRAAELLGEVQAGRAAQVSEAIGQGHEVIDLKDAAEQAVVTLVVDAGTQRDLDELTQVRSALARLQDNTYGTCTDCGEAIAFERLRAQPAAARCLACQARAESNPSLG